MAGWYPDPTGHFEYRFHNGHEWTADVSRGGQRFVDPLPRVPTVAPRNGLAVAGMVCGIVGLAIAWIPFITFAGLVVAVVGIVLAIVGLARSRQTGSGRGFAIAGIVTGACALGAGVVGIVLTVAVFRELDDYADPGPHDARITECTVADGVIVAAGTIENLGSDQQTYSVRVRVRQDGRSQDDWVVLDDVRPGATTPFSVRVPTGESTTGGPDCRILEVNGPPPFGLDADLFD